LPTERKELTDTILYIIRRLYILQLQVEYATLIPLKTKRLHYHKRLFTILFSKERT